MSRSRLVVVATIVIALAVMATTSLFVRGPSSAFHEFVFPDEPERSATSGCTPGSATARGTAALASLDYPWEALDYEVRLEGPRKSLLAVTNTGTKVIHLYVRPCQAIDQLAATLSHEFGHAVDDRYNTPADRAQIQAYRGYGPREWFGCNRCSDFATPAGDFAEVFAFLTGPPGRFRSRLAGPPAPGEQTAAMEQYFGPVAP